ncbi:hypothetical protein M3649_21165 [Ureibacillus chungkukjangi]|uniref:hypothetical protein n=1 Tax=Ureibacillus chungkukjangi TaxID=1202712 RepID=UPI0020424DF1|nr:hypothetical protein [Ureibacillus chungkukjangi]MCM3390597.1 hypothetical protein [Ureibacillus chungkukjangi]
MPQQKLTIVPVTLHPESKTTIPTTITTNLAVSVCTIKTSNTEISFYNGVEERIIQTVIREQKHL